MTSERRGQGHAVSRRRLLGGTLGAAGALAGGAAVATPLMASCAPSPQPSVPAPRTPAPRRDPGPVYTAVDGYLYAPDGSLFTPIGANVGTTGSFDWKGDARGHADAARAWGWNTVRLNLMVTAGHSWSFVAQRSLPALIDVVRSIVDEYTGAGIVVILDPHDDPTADGMDASAVEAGLAEWWHLAAAAFRDNPLVWSGLINEPRYTNDEWLRVMNLLAGAVRDAGNAGPILLGAPCWGQDLGSSSTFPEARFAYDPTMAPSLADRHGNVVLEQHNYGAFGLYSTPDKFGRYIDAVRNAGLTPLIGEFGYTVSRDQSPNVYQANYDAAGAVFEIAASQQVGALWWHATHGDNYALMSNGGPFFSSTSGEGLSDGGRRLWQFTHPQR